MCNMKYKNKLSLYGSTWVENELLEQEKVFGKIKDVYCQVIPSHGGTNKIDGTEVENSYTMQTILVRKLSIKEPKIDMCFLDSTGAKYEILDFFPNYKNNSEWEFKTRIVREV